MVPVAKLEASTEGVFVDGDTPYVAVEVVWATADINEDAGFIVPAAWHLLDIRVEDGTVRVYAMGSDGAHYVFNINAEVQEEGEDRAKATATIHIYRVEEEELGDIAGGTGIPMTLRDLLVEATSFALEAQNPKTLVGKMTLSDAVVGAASMLEVIAAAQRLQNTGRTRLNS